MTVEQADLADKIDAAVDAYVELLNNGTAEQIADLYAPDATVEDPIGADIRNTREQLVEFYSVITGMDERTATLKWKKVAGDTAVFEFTLVTKTSGLAFEITPVDIMVFNADGKVSSMRAVWRPEDLTQL
ncbi:nuclear transport factor 2 family protein [Gordonia rubripertincta]|uniref:Nuclear transport factor 2 family protein n=2 Tax=Gordonia rubripertincta TaxID=36822 RepID=A0AAW4FZ36_GORRU|nr:nuclear transport factor 2 family protein [Gordonia rubripertincta]ASR05501.1 Steroid Delta-isomerase [Gordonia rubripertincta]MBM7276221.1 nuclear transport factor 2 family protein [Gordonia rubripertincta]MDG6782754.1 nuclear transport factor 2 family protein [Gordonia rubripertincta]NKY63963.1 SnoaL-like domain-containing protein [Gordonia rubripertincta]QMU21728.1 nuclear transport factor 2 family protein [Gordonia rubripertincta]